MIRKAFLFALYVHGEQVRKDGTPYIEHPVEVALELARNGADNSLIAAGYLHDTIEDAYITKEELEAAFNREVAELVFADSEDKSKSWEERKKDALDSLKCPGDRKHKMLMCADKLSNLRSIYDGLQKEGDSVWNRFSRGKEKQAWLYNETVSALAPLEGLQMYEELKRLVTEIFNEDGNANAKDKINS